QQICSTMMAKDPAQRFATPAQAAQPLERFQDRGPESPRAPAAESGTSEYLKRSEPPSGPVEPTGTLKPPTASSSASGSIDVELIPINFSKPAEPPRRTFELSRRDYVLLATGAVGVFLAEGIGVLLAGVLRRKPSNREPPSFPEKGSTAERDN